MFERGINKATELRLLTYRLFVVIGSHCRKAMLNICLQMYETFFIGLSFRAVASSSALCTYFEYFAYNCKIF